MTDVALSVVVPVYNEAATLAELVARCRDAASAAGRPWELLVVDDASTDDTPRRLAALADRVEVRALRLPENRGQLRATLAGLREARGAVVAVLDGDLQDPPERIVDLVTALEAGGADAVFAVKTSRDDPPAFLAAQALFHGLVAAFGASGLPAGATSFCAMRRATAQRLARYSGDAGNLGALCAAVSATVHAVPYDKERRRDGSSRLGLCHHVGEGVLALTMTGALPRLAITVAAAAAALALLARPLRARRFAFAASATFGLAIVVAIASERRRREIVAELTTD